MPTMVKCTQCEGTGRTTCACQHCPGHPCAACKSRGYFVFDEPIKLTRGPTQFTEAQAANTRDILRKLGMI